MKRTVLELEAILHDQPITEETAPAFYRLLQKGLLLALVEQGKLNLEQYNWAANALS